MDQEFVTARQYCLSHEPVATFYVSPFVSILVHGIEYGIEDYVYASSEYSDDKTFYHKVRLKTDKDGRTYFNIMSLKVYTDECMKI